MDELETKWPKRLGVISLIYALGGILCQVGQGISNFFVEWLIGLSGAQIDVEIPMTLKLIQLSLVVLGLGVGVLLLVGAISLLRRRRSGVSLLKAWAVLRLVLVLVGLVVAILTMPSQVEVQRSIAEQRQTAGIREVSDEKIRQSLILSSVIKAGVLAVYPLFLGFWVSRRKVGDEVSQWA